MNTIDRVLENLQKEVELYGRSGANNVFMTDIQFSIEQEDMDTPVNCDVEGAICDVSWFFKCAKERMIVPCGNPDASFFIKFFGKNASPYGCTWNLDVLKEHLLDPDTRRAVLSNYNDPLYPPCVMLYQFQSVDYGVLDCTTTLRSSDVANVLAQDVFMTSLILDEISKLTGFKSGKLTFNLGNAHVYYKDLQHAEEFLVDYGD